MTALAQRKGLGPCLSTSAMLAAAVLLVAFSGWRPRLHSRTLNAQYPVTSNLEVWMANPRSCIFQAPQSHCSIHPDACAHCPAIERNESTTLRAGTCCGVCIFPGGTGDAQYPRGDDQYPGLSKSAGAARLIEELGYDLQDFSPCELFSRIRGRTLWFAGDSQSWNGAFHAAVCFLREFAPVLDFTRPAVQPEEENSKMNTSPVMLRGDTVKGVPPSCLELALNTRVCGVRVDVLRVLQTRVLPTLMRRVKDFPNDLMVLNAGLHYRKSRPPYTEKDKYTEDLSSFAEFRQKNRARLPRIIWSDVPPQHFQTLDGSFPADNKTAWKCQANEGWEAGDATVRAGGSFNLAAAPFVPLLSDAHLHTWAASMPLWQHHVPGECTHWTHPSAYQLWLLLLNSLLKDNPWLLARQPAGRA